MGEQFAEWFLWLFFHPLGLLTYFACMCVLVAGAFIWMEIDSARSQRRRRALIEEIDDNA